MENNEPILSIRNLTVVIEREGGSRVAIDDLSIDVPKGSTVALVGESGSGKSLIAFSTMGVLPLQARIVSGSILFENQNLLRFTDRQMQKLRGNRIAMIFQEPGTSLNPVVPVGLQIGESIRIHNKLDREIVRGQVLTLMEMVGIPDPRRRYRSYPHQLSGGIRQRVVIAMALACRPDLLLADEPTSALDTTVQAQIVDLLSRLKRDLGMSALLITHDLGVTAALAHRVVVLHEGRIMEEGTVRQILKEPLHPYTKTLLDSRRSFLKDIIEPLSSDAKQSLGLRGECSFMSQCSMKTEECNGRAVGLVDIGQGRRLRCLAMERSFE